MAFFVTLFALERQWWYRRNPVGKEAEYEIPEVTALFMVGGFLYAGAGLAFGWGGRWRKRFYYNPGLAVSSFVVIVLAVFLTFMSPKWDGGISAIFKAYDLPLDFRIWIVIFGIFFFSDLILWELLIVSGPVATYLRHATHTGRVAEFENESLSPEASLAKSVSSVSSVDARDTNVLIQRQTLRAMAEGELADEEVDGFIDEEEEEEEDMPDDRDNVPLLV